MPAFNMELSPQPVQPNPFNRGAPPPSPPVDLAPLMTVLGVEWPSDRLAWDKYNPHPQLGALPEEIVFVAAENEVAAAPFNMDEPVSSGLQEIVLIHAGTLRPADGARWGQRGVRPAPRDRHRLGHAALVATRAAVAIRHAVSTPTSRTSRMPRPTCSPPA